ncbi:MAG: hypothetical protein GVY16_02760 [Planctomycetes bacterium]|nr:hypothetical protein [Planctomycetota bacterium]
MLRFKVYRDGKPADGTDLSGAYLFGQDGIPIRADIVSSRDQITCMKRVGAACGLSLLWDAGDGKRCLLGTTRLPERSEPYNLNLELLRAQIMLLYQKREDWALFDLPEADDLNEEFAGVRQAFVRAMVVNVSDPGAAAAMADEALRSALSFGERLALFHSDIVMRQHDSAMRRLYFGSRALLEHDSPAVVKRLRDGFDFVLLPIPWRSIEPKEGSRDFGRLDAWMNWANREKHDIHGGPLLSFEPEFLPEWLYGYENDFDDLRDHVFGHIQHIVKRYADVNVWHVISGLEAINPFNLSFDQIMELTRTCCQLVKTLAPDSTALIDVAMPWGEYYARNQRTIPPMLYADMTYQSNIKFDAFGVRINMGMPADGHYVRDVLRISALLDEFHPHGKDVYVTAAGVPSQNGRDPADSTGGHKNPSHAGSWRGPWSPKLQATWLQTLVRLSMSKPYVKGICWLDVADLPGHDLPHGGLCAADLRSKPAWKEMRAMRQAMIAGQKPAGVGSETPGGEAAAEAKAGQGFTGPKPGLPGEEA